MKVSPTWIYWSCNCLLLVRSWIRSDVRLTIVIAMNSIQCRMLLILNYNITMITTIHFSSVIIGPFKVQKLLHKARPDHRKQTRISNDNNLTRTKERIDYFKQPMTRIWMRDRKIEAKTLFINDEKEETQK